MPPSITSTEPDTENDPDAFSPTTYGFEVVVDPEFQWNRVENERFHVELSSPGRRDGIVQAALLDHPNGDPFVDSVPAELPTLLEFAEERAALFPDWFGPTPFITSSTLDGRPAIRIVGPETSHTQITLLAEAPLGVSWRMIEISMDEATEAEFVDGFTWTAEPYVPAALFCPAGTPPGDPFVHQLSTDVDADGVVDRLYSWQDPQTNDWLVQAEVVDGWTTPTVVDSSGLPEIVAAIDFDSDGADELVVNVGGNTAITALVLWLDGCDFRPVRDAEGVELRPILSATGNSCASTGCYVRVSCMTNSDGTIALVETIASPNQEQRDEFVVRTFEHRISGGQSITRAAPEIARPGHALKEDEVEGWHEGLAHCDSLSPTASERALVDSLVAWAAHPTGPPPISIAADAQISTYPLKS